MELSNFDRARARLTGPSEEWRSRAWDRLDRLTMPPRAMGRLMELAADLAAMRRRLAPAMDRFTIVPFCADHGLFRPEVTNSPRIVTELVTRHMAEGSATVNLMARLQGGDVVPVDVGVAGDMDDLPRGSLLNHKVGRGTADVSCGPAMSREQAIRCLDVGVAVADSLAGSNDFLAVGEMGVGNTTAATILAAALTGLDPAALTGLGSGIDQVKRARKVALVRRALAVNPIDRGDDLGLAARLGSFETVALAGFMIGAAARELPVVLDGFVTASAALLAVRLAPAVRGYLVASHLASEQGHGAVLDHLGLRPLMELELHLGEGAGCALAAPLLRAAVALMGLPTFEETGVPEGISADGRGGRS